MIIIIIIIIDFNSNNPNGLQNSEIGVARSVWTNRPVQHKRVMKDNGLDFSCLGLH